MDFDLPVALDLLFKLKLSLRTHNVFFCRSYHTIFVSLAAAAIFTFAGCSNSDTKPPKSTATAKSGETEAEKCRKKLAGAIRRLDPELLMLQSNPERSINGLNAWLASCATDELEQLELNEAALKLVDSNVRATAGRYTVNDSSYIRDCLLLRDLTSAVLERVTTSEGEISGQDVKLVKATFDWVVRNVSLIEETEERPPLGLFDILVTGRGRPEDRAWIFAEALRQQQIDAFIVTPTEEGKAKEDESDSVVATADWLVAVALEDTSMVFDMKSGLPVTDADTSDDLLNLKPMGLPKLAEHDRWKKSSAHVIAQIAAFAPRMLILQQQLAVEDSAVLFEELTGGVSEIRPIRDRIASVSDGLWKVDEVLVWNYPEDTSVASQSLTEAQRSEYTKLMKPFEAPFERTAFATESTEELTTVPEELSAEQREELVQRRLSENFAKMMGSSEEMFGKPSKRLLKTRVRQVLSANDTGVIQQLQQIRITSMESVVKIQVPKEVRVMIRGNPAVIEIPIPQMIREVNLSSTGAALYWSALRQIELGDVGAAITTLMNYRRQYSDGQWMYPSMINQAIAFVVQERIDEAVALLKEADVEANPERFRVQQMLKILAP